MTLTPDVLDRAAGVLLGQASGDALGVPYEFEPRITLGTARMVGGGLGPYAPGEWSDDTQMAVVIAQVAATGADLRTPDALDAIAEGFLDWQARGASDIGNQTRAVLAAARRAHGPVGERMTTAAAAPSFEGKAGNGALMRTGVVGLVALGDADAMADAARRVAALTHPDVRCLDSCVLWSEAVRVAVTEVPGRPCRDQVVAGRAPRGVAGLDRAVRDRPTGQVHPERLHGHGVPGGVVGCPHHPTP